MNVDVSFFRRHFAASISILTGRNVSTVGEFGTYILQKEIPILVAPENSTLKQYVIHSFCALYEGCSNMNASSFITFFSYMLRQNVIPF